MKKRVIAFQQNMLCGLLEYKNTFLKPSSDFAILVHWRDFFKDGIRPPKFRCSHIKQKQCAKAMFWTTKGQSTCRGVLDYNIIFLNPCLNF